MSKRCIECEHAKSGSGENSAEFHVWYEGHISSCTINHIGSSCAMEQKAALKLWQRSENNGFRYTTLLSDGDAKTFQYLIFFNNNFLLFGKRAGFSIFVRGDKTARAGPTSGANNNTGSKGHF
ncbi:uncharacterized protein TNCV_462741 [Trichonephila clavipes]|nr:uncharacterized protein TNCV_462741 [Trichonephila clavipes]